MSLNLFLNLQLDTNAGSLHNDSLTGIIEANKQGAFVFWNHPNWISQRNDGIARLEPYHKYLIKNKLLHGIEVVNENSFSEEAFRCFSEEFDFNKFFSPLLMHLENIKSSKPI